LPKPDYFGQDSPFVADDVAVSGYVYEVETARLRTVVPAGA